MKRGRRCIVPPSLSYPTCRAVPWCRRNPVPHKFCPFYPIPPLLAVEDVALSPFHPIPTNTGRWPINLGKRGDGGRVGRNDRKAVKKFFSELAFANQKVAKNLWYRFSTCKQNDTNKQTHPEFCVTCCCFLNKLRIYNKT